MFAAHRGKKSKANKNNPHCLYLIRHFTVVTLTVAALFFPIVSHILSHGSMQRKKYIYLYMNAQTRKFWQDITITWFQPCAFNRVYVWFIHGNYVWWAMNLQKKHGQMKEEPYWKPTTWILRADSRNESQWLICNYKLHTGISQCARTSFKCKPHWTWNLKTTTTSTKKKHSNYIVEVTFKGRCLSTAIKHFKLPCIGPNTE